MSKQFEQAKKFVTRGVAAQRAIDKLCHKSDPQTSYDAAEKIVKSGALSRQEEEVYKAIKDYTREIRTAGSLRYTNFDFTTKDIALSICNNSYHKDYDICRRRFSGLRDKGKIERILATDNEGILLLNKKGKLIYRKRDGCTVWRLK